MIAAVISVVVLLLCVVIVSKTAYLRSGAEKAALFCGVMAFKLCFSQENQQRILRDATMAASRPQQQEAAKAASELEKQAEADATDAMLLSQLSGPRGGRAARMTVKGPPGMKGMKMGGTKRGGTKGGGLSSVGSGGAATTAARGGMRSNQVLPLPSEAQIAGSVQGEEEQQEEGGGEEEEEDLGLAIAKRIRQENKNRASELKKGGGQRD
jgi:hypothetical protein